jgi:hypothetical protein
MSYMPALCAAIAEASIDMLTHEITIIKHLEHKTRDGRATL